MPISESTEYFMVLFQSILDVEGVGLLTAKLLLTVKTARELLQLESRIADGKFIRKV